MERMVRERRCQSQSRRIEEVKSLIVFRSVESRSCVEASWHLPSITALPFPSPRCARPSQREGEEHRILQLPRREAGRPSQGEGEGNFSFYPPPGRVERSEGGRARNKLQHLFWFASPRCWLSIQSPPKLKTQFVHSCNRTVLIAMKEHQPNVSWTLYPWLCRTSIPSRSANGRWFISEWPNIRCRQRMLTNLKNQTDNAFLRSYPNGLRLLRPKCAKPTVDQEFDD